MKIRLPVLLLLAAGLLFGGCASYDTDPLLGHGRGLTGLQRFFVVTNLNDNRALDHRIAGALQARGLTVDTGPLTMMPDNTQAVVTYQDHWSWDFGEHLVVLKLSVRGPDSNETLAAATFNARIPLKEPVPETVGRLVARLFEPTSTPPPESAKPDQDPRSGSKKRAR